MSHGFLFFKQYDDIANTLSAEDKKVFLHDLIRYCLYNEEPSYEAGSALAVAWLAKNLIFERIEKDTSVCDGK